MLIENGGVISFESLASNLVDDDAAGVLEVMRKDIQSGGVTLLSTDENGAPANTPAPPSPPCSPVKQAIAVPNQFNTHISRDARYVAFQSNDARSSRPARAGTQALA